MINLIYNTSIGRNKKLVLKKLLKTTVVLVPQPTRHGHQ